MTEPSAILERALPLPGFELVVPFVNLYLGRFGLRGEFSFGQLPLVLISGSHAVGLTKQPTAFMTATVIEVVLGMVAFDTNALVSATFDSHQFSPSSQGVSESSPERSSSMSSRCLVASSFNSRNSSSSSEKNALHFRQCHRPIGPAWKR